MPGNAWHMTDVIFIFHFGLFFALLPPNIPKNQNHKKKKRKKTPGDIIILDLCTKNFYQMMYGSSDIVRDRHTDGKSDIQRWETHLKIN